MFILLFDVTQLKLCNVLLFRLTVRLDLTSHVLSSYDMRP